MSSDGSQRTAEQNTFLERRCLWKNDAYDKHVHAFGCCSSQGILASPRGTTQPHGLVAGMAFVFVPIAADRSKHRPGNIAPIQLISAVGAWALILLNQAVLASSLRQGLPILACASFATNLTALWPGEHRLRPNVGGIAIEPRERR